MIEHLDHLVLTTANLPPCVPMPGALDLCFITSEALAVVQQRLAQHGVAVVEGPVRRTGARGPIESVYVRDPDGNLIELSRPL